MKQLLFIGAFSLILLTGKSRADVISKRMSDDKRQHPEMNICSAVEVAVDQYIIDEQDTSEIDGFSLFADDPEMLMVSLRNKGFLIYPVILSSSQLKIITLATDLPPPLIS